MAMENWEGGNLYAEDLRAQTAGYYDRVVDATNAKVGCAAVSGDRIYLTCLYSTDGNRESNACGPWRPCGLSRYSNLFCGQRVF